MADAHHLDPYLVLDDWLAGTWTDAHGQEVAGRTWSADARYRYREILESWFHYIGDQVWTAQALHIAHWSETLRTKDGARPLHPTSRRRAVSVVRSYYRHCDEDLGHHGDRLPARRILAGPAPQQAPAGLHPAQGLALMSAADRYRGPMPERARLAVYLLLANLRPGQAVRLRADSIRREQHRVTAAVPQKNNTDSATAWRELPRPVVWALDDYLPVRTWRTPHSTATTGPLLLSRNGRAIDRVNTLKDIVRTVAAGHPDLTELAPALSPDAVAHTLSPFTPAP
ncbi:hypothetical protein [Streptomyces sp. NPDC087538]|uniref:hypothetical protein n=1 Tax=Streptomyces sp. NPDC087538 TaxID=3365797 RepID=UPI0037F33573